MAYIGHDLTAVLLCLEATHRRHCLLDGRKEVFQALAEGESGRSEDCLPMVQQSKVQDVGHEVPEENGVLTTVDIQLPIQTYPRCIDTLRIALPSGQLPCIFEECLPLDAVVIVRSKNGSIVL